MPEYDLVIRGGTVVDGTGIPRVRADLAIKDGRVAMISGRIHGGGAKELDASGCIVAPGAIDLHTHYDAQLNWDPYASLSGQFGVTSLTVGQCGFGFAPTRPEDRDLNMRMMNRIEAIPLESMRQGMRWDWETFPEYMDSLERQGLGVNVGCVVPFSPLRGYVLGMIPARERTSVTQDELNPDEADSPRSHGGRSLWPLRRQEPGRPARGRQLASQPRGVERGVPGLGPGAGPVRRGPHRLDHRHLRRPSGATRYAGRDGADERAAAPRDPRRYRGLRVAEGSPRGRPAGYRSGNWPFP